MRFVVTIQHPAHVHFFKHAAEELLDAGHEVAVFARAKDVTHELLAATGLPFEMLVGPARSLPELALAQLRYEYRLFQRVRGLDPDVVTGIGGLAASHVASLVGARSVVFTDTELSTNRLVVPFADAICTPRTFPDSFGSTHLRYDGFHELAYLGPGRFDADEERLRAFGVDPDGWYAVLRFSDMRAHHDVGYAGLSPTAKADLVSTLSAHGPVYLCVESADEVEMEVARLVDRGAHRLPVPPELLHDLLSEASLVVTDSATTATEAGVLGTPTVRVSHTAGDDDLRNFRILGERYGLVYSTADERDALASARAFAEGDETVALWERRRADLLADCIDVTDFVVSVLVAVGGHDDPDRAVAEVRTRG